MAEITVDKKVLELLQEYISDKDFDALTEIGKFNEEDFVFKFKYNKYKSCINAPAARIIINFQETIYKLVAFSLHGRTDIRLLTKDEKDELEIPFKITEGSTVEEVSKLLSGVKNVLNMIPKNQRPLVLIAIVIIVFSFLGWLYYCSVKKAEFETSVLIEESKSKERLLSQAIEKLSKEQPEIAIIIRDADNDILSNLSEVDSSIEVQGQQITSEELKLIKKQKYPTDKKKKEIQKINGRYRIIAVDLKKDYITVEDACNEDVQPIRIYYERDSLLAYMQKLKQQLKNAIDNESKIFDIKAHTKEDNNSMYLLESIDDIKEVTKCN